MRLTGSQIIIKLLEKQGISMVAGIPGGSILPFYDELAKSSIRHILVRQEQAAGFIAQGIARSTGKTAVCLATSGPGAMNLLTAIADARCDSIPLVAITGQVNSYLIGTDAFQEADTFGLSFPITKHSIMIKKVEELFTAIPAAFAIAASGRPGPVLVDVPRDIQSAVYEFEEFPEPKLPVIYHEKYCTKKEDLPQLSEKIADILLASEKPVLFAGGGCNSAKASELVHRFLEVFPMPVVSSLMGIGVVPCTSENYIGMAGMHGSVAANQCMYASDTVFACGAHFDDRAIGKVQEFCPNAKIIHIDIDAAEINKIYPAEASIAGDCVQILPLIIQTLEKKLAASKKSCSSESLASVRKFWLEEMKALRKQTFSAETGAVKNCVCKNPRKFITEIPEFAKKDGIAPSDLIVTTDVGQHQMWTAQYYPVLSPRTFLTSGSLGTMGFGLPAAIGAALANPQKRVVCFSGDGSIMMNIQELATLAELNLNVTVILFQNGTLGMVRQQQKYLFDRNFSASEFGAKPDFSAIAQGFGIRTANADEDSQWYRNAFSAADGKNPCFVVVKTDPEEDVLPFVKPGHPNIESWN